MKVNIATALALAPDTACTMAESSPTMYTRMIRESLKERVSVETDTGEVSYVYEDGSNWCINTQNPIKPEKVLELLFTMYGYGD